MDGREKEISNAKRKLVDITNYIKKLEDFQAKDALTLSETMLLRDIRDGKVIVVNPRTLMPVNINVVRN
jgi:hypothetical protein